MDSPALNPQLIQNSNNGPDTIIPHPILNNTSETGELQAVTHKEFREYVDIIKKKVAEVSQRSDAAFNDTEARQMLGAMQRLVPIMSDMKDYLIQNNVVENEGEYEDIKRTIINLNERSSIKNIDIFPQYRDSLKTLTQTKTLRNGFDFIETIKQDITTSAANTISSPPAKNNKPQQESKIEEQISEVGGKLKASFKIPREIKTGEEIEFENTSQKADRFAWRIVKDGQEVAVVNDSKELKRAFNDPGVYYVSLIAGDGDTFDSVTKIVNVAGPAISPQVDTPIISRLPASASQTIEQTIPADVPITNENSVLTTPDTQNTEVPNQILQTNSANTNTPEIVSTPQTYNNSSSEGNTQLNDPYIILGINKGADIDTIRKAYRNLAKQIHPDLNPNDPNAHTKMQELNSAFASIINEIKDNSQVTIPGNSNEITNTTTPAQLTQTPVQATENLSVQPVLTSPTFIQNQTLDISLPQSNTPSKEQITLDDLVKLSPLGRRAMWPMLTKEQRTFLTEHPFKEEWQIKLDNWADEKFFLPSLGKNNKTAVKDVYDFAKFKWLRDGIKNKYTDFKQRRLDSLNNSANKGNQIARWTQQKYLAFKKSKNNKESVLKLAGYVGRESLKAIFINPVKNMINSVGFLRDSIKAFQGATNFGGKTLTTIGRIGSSIGNSVKFAFLPTLMTSLMGANPLLAAGMFAGIGLARQAFNSLDILKSPVGFKLPFVDSQLTKFRVFNELRLNPHRYEAFKIGNTGNYDTAKFAERYRNFVEEFNLNPNLAKTGKLFSFAKHLISGVPLGTVASGITFLLTGNLPLAIAIGGGTLAARAGISFAAERMGMSMGRGLVGSPLVRHIFKLPGMSFLDAAEGSKWVNSEFKYMREEGFNKWLESQNETAIQLGPVTVTKGMSNVIMLLRSGFGAGGIVKFFATMPSAISASSTGALGFLSKIPLLTKIAGPAAILGYLAGVAGGLISFSWAGFLGLTFGVIAGTLALPLLSTLIGIPIYVAVSYGASKFGEWLGGFFDKAGEIASDIGNSVATIIPLIQLGKALYDIVNSTIEDLSDYARLGLISLSIIPAIGILVQLAEMQASANIEPSNNTEITSSTLNYNEEGSKYSFEIDQYNYDCSMSHTDIFYSELEFVVTDIIALNQNNTDLYTLKGTIKPSGNLIYANMLNINPDIKIGNSIKAGEIVGSC